MFSGIDYTKSNEYSGAKSFGRNMHDITAVVKNPYQQVIEIIGKTLEVFDDDKLIPTFGFGTSATADSLLYLSLTPRGTGDSTTGDKRVFPFFPDRPCQTFREVLARYNEITPKLQLSGPTNFAPLV
jgi:E3 ubiquitin-protein ligase RGLG